MKNVTCKCIHSEVHATKYGKDAAPSQAKFMPLWISMFAYLFIRDIIHSPFAQQILFLICTGTILDYSREKTGEVSTFMGLPFKRGNCEGIDLVTQIL